MTAEPLAEERGINPAGQDHVRRFVIEEEGDVRPKNQITIPRAVARAMGLQVGDRLVFVVDQEGGGHAHLYRMPTSFAGIAPHAYGADRGTKSYLERERQAWGD